jgi:hypothetical protein
MTAVRRKQLGQLGDIAGNPSRLVFSEQLGCHASLIFGVWLICAAAVVVTMIGIPNRLAPRDGGAMDQLGEKLA